MTKTIHVEGMMCEHCVARVTKALSAVNGVEKADVKLVKHGKDKGGIAVVTAAEEIADEALTEAIVQAGYTVKGID